MVKKKINPIHPGEVLLEEFMKPLNLSQYKVAKSINVSPRRINEIVHGLRGITADTALRLGTFFGVSPQFWMNLQAFFDLEVEKDKMLHTIEKEVHPLHSKAA